MVVILLVNILSISKGVRGFTDIIHLVSISPLYILLIGVVLYSTILNKKLEHDKHKKWADKIFLLRYKLEDMIANPTQYKNTEKINAMFKFNKLTTKDVKQSCLIKAKTELRT